MHRGVWGRAPPLPAAQLTQMNNILLRPSASSLATPAPSQTRAARKRSERVWLAKMSPPRAPLSG
eukprot:1598789-Pyramimonas_sp.AAC.2